MKRTAMQHTKLKRLVRALKVPQYAAVGILESLWHLTAREAPEGNIGKLSNEDIAAWIDWDGTADSLIEGLVTAGWLDEVIESRLVVHDWHEHADDATKKAIDRQRKKSADNGGNVQTKPDKTRLPEPLPEPEPVPKPTTSTLASTALAVPAARGKLVCTLPLNQGDHEVFEADVQEWQALYLAVDVRQELRSIKGWALSNPTRRKTKSGIGRFINSWLSRAQNEAKPGGGNVRTHGKTAGNLNSLEQAERFAREQYSQSSDDPSGETAGPGFGGDSPDLLDGSGQLLVGRH